MEILIAEDEFSSRNLLKKVLTKLGHEVIVTETGQEAWTLLQDRKIKIVICNWTMPQMDGLALCHKIRSLKQHDYIYVILLTANDRKTNRVDVLRAGADDYIPKPIDPEELRARVMTGIRVADLQERHRQLATTLIESRNKFRVVLDSLKEEIVSLDKQLRIVSVNTPFSKKLGLPSEEVVGKNYFNDPLISGPTGRSKTLLDIVQSVFDSGKEQCKLIKSSDSSGADLFRQVTCLPIVDDTDRVFQVVLVSLDITENRRKTEEIESLSVQLKETASQIETKNQSLESALKRLEVIQAQMLHSEKMASIGQLAAGVAHEINNPTGFISSNLKTMSDYQEGIGELLVKYHELVSILEKSSEKGKTDAAVSAKLGEIKSVEKDIDIEFLLEDIVDLVGDCQEGTDRIKKIVIDLKDFAHPGEDKLQTTDINTGLESTLNVVNNEIKYKATVHKDFGDIPAIKGYPQQLNQVFMNILVNAAQSIEKNGEIGIRTRNSNGRVEVRISDTGCGISEENLGKIFDPFFTTKEVGRGTGLGMNIANHIIQNHNGTIEVESAVGKGTTFIITIPADETSSSPDGCGRGRGQCVSNSLP
jgi:two-component system NtrC family sensor kinase